MILVRYKADLKKKFIRPKGFKGSNAKIIYLYYFEKEKYFGKLNTGTRDALNIFEMICHL